MYSSESIIVLKCGARETRAGVRPVTTCYVVSLQTLYHIPYGIFFNMVVWLAGQMLLIYILSCPLQTSQSDLLYHHITIARANEYVQSYHNMSTTLLSHLCITSRGGLGVCWRLLYSLTQTSPDDAPPFFHGGSSQEGGGVCTMTGMTDRASSSLAQAWPLSWHVTVGSGQRPCAAARVVQAWCGVVGERFQWHRVHHGFALQTLLQSMCMTWLLYRAPLHLRPSAHMWVILNLS